MKKDEVLKLEKLKFKYRYLRDLEKHNFFIYIFVLGTLSFPVIIKGKEIFQIIGVFLFVGGLVLILLDIKKIQSKMEDTFKKIMDI